MNGRDGKAISKLRLRAMVVALGQIWAICASVPLKFVSDLIGWRTAFFALGAISVLLSAAVYFIVPDKESGSGGSAGNMDLSALVAPGFIALVLWFFISGGLGSRFKDFGGRHSIPGCLICPPRSPACCSHGFPSAVSPVRWHSAI